MTKSSIQNTFILGLGNQKCGTTWLRKYLENFKNFDGGVAKEYHVWDALDIPIMFYKKASLIDSIRSRKYRVRRGMQRLEQKYFEYFAGLYSNDVNISADITPSYSGLSTERLAYIKKEFDQRGICTKSVILIRDPVRRIKSAVRYNLDKGNYREGVGNGEKDFISALGQYYVTDHCRMRTSYNVIIQNALQVFDKQDVYVGIYENMFEPDEISRLSDFCMVPVKADYADVYVKKTASKVESNDLLEVAIRDRFQDVYDYCYEAFPVTKKLWQPEGAGSAS